MEEKEKTNTPRERERRGAVVTTTNDSLKPVRAGRLNSAARINRGTTTNKKKKKEKENKTNKDAKPTPVDANPSIPPPPPPTKVVAVSGMK